MRKIRGNFMNKLELAKNKVKEILNIKKRYYKCAYCNEYTNYDTKSFVKALGPKITDHKLYFCNEFCKDKFIDMHLPYSARKYK